MGKRRCCSTPISRAPCGARLKVWWATRHFGRGLGEAARKALEADGRTWTANAARVVALAIGSHTKLSP